MKSSKPSVGFRFATPLQFVLSSSCPQPESFGEPGGLSSQGARQIAKEAYFFTWVRSCALGALALAILVGYAHAQDTKSVGAGKKPNIVVVLMDNLGWGECLTLFADNALSGEKVAIALDKVVPLRVDHRR